MTEDVQAADAARWRNLRRMIATKQGVEAFVARLEKMLPPEEPEEWFTEAEIDRIFDAACKQ